MNNLTTKLHECVAKVCPIDGLNSNGTIFFKPEATEEERAKAKAVFEAFDWSDEAAKAYELELVKRTALEKVKENIVLRALINVLGVDIQDLTNEIEKLCQ